MTVTALKEQLAQVIQERDGLESALQKANAEIQKESSV